MSENGDPDRLGDAGMPDRPNHYGGEKIGRLNRKSIRLQCNSENFFLKADREI